MSQGKATLFNFEKATPRELESWYELRLDHQREIYPEDPEPDLDYLLSRALALDNTQEGRAWAAWSEEGEMLAWCRAHVSKSGFFPESATFGITVKRPHRRRRLGTALLGRVLEAAEHFGRSKLRAYSKERCPAAESFLRAIGAETVSSTTWNQLKLDRVDPDLISDWLALPSERSRQVVIGGWEGPTPEEHIPELCDLCSTVNAYQREQEGEEVPDTQLTPELYRRGEKWAFSGGRKGLLLYARDAKTNRLVGISEVLWNPAMPQILKQGYTAVLPKYRGRGIGKRLKAEMIRRIRKSMPEASVIRTGNFDKRKAILGINSGLGYKPFMTQQGWMVTTEKVRDYLSARKH